MSDPSFVLDKTHQNRLGRNEFAPSVWKKKTEEEKMIAALENAEATPQQQKEAARIVRDSDRELRELLEWEQLD